MNMYQFEERDPSILEPLEVALSKIQMSSDEIPHLVDEWYEYFESDPVCVDPNCRDGIDERVDHRQVRDDERNCVENGTVGPWFVFSEEGFPWAELFRLGDAQAVGYSLGIQGLAMEDAADLLKEFREDVVVDAQSASRPKHVAGLLQDVVSRIPGHAIHWLVGGWEELRLGPYAGGLERADLFEDWSRVRSANDFAFVLTPDDVADFLRRAERLEQAFALIAERHWNSEVVRQVQARIESRGEALWSVGWLGEREELPRRHMSVAPLRDRAIADREAAEEADRQRSASRDAGRGWQEELVSHDSADSMQEQPVFLHLPDLPERPAHMRAEEPPY